MQEKFWFVWCPTGSPPTRKHMSLKEAEREAERLATHNRGAEFVILESIKQGRKSDVQWENHVDSMMPF